MTNEQYLVVSYFALGIVSLVIAFATYLWLRRSFFGIMHALPDGHLTSVLRKLFFVGILLSTLAGFLSVSFRGCEKDNYQQIVADRSYIVAKNQEQVSSSLSYTVGGLMGWGFIVLAALVTIKTNKTKGSA